MLFNTKLRFYAQGQAQVPHFEREDRGIKSYVGRRIAEPRPGEFGFEPTPEPEEVAYHHDLAKACRDGDLLAADEATAKACGVVFDKDAVEERKAAAAKAAKTSAKQDAPKTTSAGADAAADKKTGGSPAQGG